jgi:hypothetical protein
VATAWTAPLVIAASSAPAHAGSVGAPAVTTSGLTIAQGTITTRDASMTFTNNGTAAASLLTVVINIRILQGAYDNNITNLTHGWDVTGPEEVPNVGRLFTFIRASGIGLGPANAQPLAFRFGAFNTADGIVTVNPPTTTPAGANSGATATFGVVPG